MAPANLRGTLPSTLCPYEGWTWRTSETCHAPWMKVVSTLSPLHQSPGNLFPGPSRQSRPWPAQHCWLRFPYFLVFSSPLPQAPLPALSPSPHPRNWNQRGGELGRGLRGGVGQPVGQHQDGEAVRSHPWPRARMRFGSTSCPACPRDWLGADQKLE